MISNSFLSRILIVNLINLFLFTGVSSAQPGALDSKFSTGSGFLFETGKSAAIYSMVLQPDGKIVVGGQFVSFNGNKCSHIVRLNADGSFDESFNTGFGFNNPVRTVSIQADGKIIAGGQFTSFDDKQQNHIIRLNADGSKDESFNVGSAFNDVVYASIIQPDGRIVTGGKFTNFNGTWQNYVSRLNADGTIDVLFDAEKGFNDIVYALALENDDKIVAGGIFTAFNGSTANRIIRLNADGKADGSFNSGTGFDNDVRALTVDANERIIAGGYFSGYNGKNNGYIVRINTNGTLDETFKTGTGFNGSVLSLLAQNNNQVIAGGYYTAYNGTDRKNISRLNSDGTIDNSFNSGKGTNGGVIAVREGKKIYLGGGFTTYNDAAANQICRLISEPYIISVLPASSVCAGSVVKVEFSSEGTFNEGNIFRFSFQILLEFSEMRQS